MSIEYGPVGERVADRGAREKRFKEYDQTSSLLTGIIEAVLSRIDRLMDAAQRGYSMTIDDGTMYHRYNQMFRRELYSVLVLPVSEYTEFSALRISHRKPVNYVSEQYHITINHGDIENPRLVGSSYIFTRYGQSGVAAQTQYSLDLPDWITDPEGGPGIMWHDATPYDMRALNDELYQLQTRPRSCTQGSPEVI